MRISIGLKLMTLAGIGSVILAAVGLYGTWSSWSSIHEIHWELDNTDAQQHDIHSIDIEYKTEIQEWKNLLLRSTDDTSLKKRWDIYAAQYGKVTSVTLETVNKIRNEQAKSLLKSFIEAHKNNHELYRKATLILKEHNFDIRPADHAVEDIHRPLSKILQQASHEMSLEAERIGSQVIKHAEHKIYLSLAIGAVVFVLEGLFFIFMIRRFITVPTASVLAGLNTLKSGNFTGTLPKLHNDELGDIGGLTQQVSQELGLLISNVKIAADRLAETAQRVAMVSSMTSEGVKNQCEETDHASHAMKEMSDSMQLSVERADEAVATASSVSQQVAVVNSVLNETVRAVQALADEVKNTAGAIQALKDETQSIGDVAKTIRSIADQTNLLALNAAIEAARAGEQGRGFAVVADEVRKLAQTTQNATSDIEQRIDTLQAGASNAMNAMMEGCERADKSVAQATEARKVLDSITQAAASIRGINERIVEILGDQKIVANTITGTIMNISQVAEQTAHSSRQTSEEIVNVAVEAVRLDEMVEAFILPAVEQKDQRLTAPRQPASKDDSIELF